MHWLAKHLVGLRLSRLAFRMAGAALPSSHKAFDALPATIDAVSGQTSTTIAREDLADYGIVRDKAIDAIWQQSDCALPILKTHRRQRFPELIRICSDCLRIKRMLPCSHS